MTLKPGYAGLLLFAATWVGPALPSAWAAVPADPVERAMYFVEKSAQATELFNAGRPADALVTFQEILAGCPELDEDGYVAISIGDCLAALDQPAEARSAYAAALAAHPEMKAGIEARMAELDLSGAITDALIARLRLAAQAKDDARFAANWRLGRALLGRAEDLLREATAAFDTVKKSEGLCELSRALAARAVSLAELSDDLASMKAELTDLWKAGRPPTGGGRTATPARLKGVVTETVRSERTVRIAQGGRVEIQIRLDTGECEFIVTVNGKPVKLTDAQKASLRRHEERISAILLEAADEAK